MDPLSTLSLTSITGIIAATFVVMEVLKRVFSKNTWFGKIPAWCYSVVVAMILSVLANKVFKDAAGNPLLPGSLEQTLWHAFLAAASSGGFYSWLNMTTIADSQPLQSPSAPESKPQPQLNPPAAPPTPITLQVVESKPQPSVVVVPAASAFIKKP